jgi:mannose-6-phosphate isomerase-like protein (cupin superfamily)
VLSRNLQDLVHFSPQAVTRETVFEAPNLWSQLVCLDRNQHIGPVADRDSDGMFTVLAGEGVFLVDRKRRRVGQWHTVLVPAGSEVSVTNASADPLVILMVASPPPGAHAVTG